MRQSAQAMGENVMQGSGLYNEHSVQQAEAAEAGVALLRAAAGEIPLPGDGSIVLADYGGLGGEELAAAVAGRSRR